MVVVVVMIAPKCDDHRRQWQQHQQQQHQQQVIFHHHFQLSSSSLPAATARNMRHVAAFDFWDDDADGADAGGGTRPGRDTSYCVFSLLGRDKGQNKTVREVIYQLKSDPRPDKIRSRRYSFLSFFLFFSLFLSFSLFFSLLTPHRSFSQQQQQQQQQCWHKSANSSRDSSSSPEPQPNEKPSIDVICKADKRAIKVFFSCPPSLSPPKYSADQCLINTLHKTTQSKGKRACV